MMTYSIGGGQVYHHPGAIALALLRDVGWNIPGALNAPTGPAAAPASPTSIQITWSDTNASPNETGYTVERSTTGSDPWTVVATTAANAVSYTDTVDSVSNPYYYRVRAANGGALYCPSSVVFLTPSAVLNAPMGLTAAALTPERVQLSWNEANLYADGYRVERSENGSDGPWALLGTVAPFSLGFRDDTAREGTRYDYRVTAFALEPAGESPPAEAQALTPLLAPAGLSAALTAGSAVALTWTDASALETGYTAERSLDGKSGWQPACRAPAGAQSCSDPAAAPGIWYFRVRAERSADPANTSAWSGPIRLVAANHVIFAPLIIQ
jgi:hypothetical protein